MAKALKCDRCGQFYDLLTEYRNYKIRDFLEPIKGVPDISLGNSTYEKYVDLCPDCYDKLLNFLDEIKNQDLIGSGELYPGEFESRHYEFEEDLK